MCQFRVDSMCSRAKIIQRPLARQCVVLRKKKPMLFKHGRRGWQLTTNSYVSCLSSNSRVKEVGSICSSRLRCEKVLELLGNANV